MGLQKLGTPNTQQLFLVDALGQPFAQVAPYPLITIERVEPTPGAIESGSMSIDGVGEFYYVWSPPTAGQYRVKYEYRYLGASYFTFEDVDVQKISEGETVVIGTPLVGVLGADDTLVGTILNGNSVSAVY